jgi:hypothetical protein
VTDEEINKAIAEACGWQFKEVFESSFSDPSKKVSRGKKWHSPTGYQTNLPDYCNDLNAMHEAEKQAGMKVIKGMRFWLYEMTDQMLAHHATARQRAEAFLKTTQQEKGK